MINLIMYYSCEVIQKNYTVVVLNNNGARHVGVVGKCIVAAVLATFIESGMLKELRAATIRKH